MEKAARNPNHELLRLLAMYMIVFIHANIYLGAFCEGRLWTFFNGMVNGICNIGVSCFILISGYYGVKFSIRKFVKMECMMITYSLLETAFLFWMAPEQMQGAALLEQLIKSFLPFITRKYWFYSAYVCLLFLSGYLQKFIDCLDRETFKRLLLLLLTLFSVLPTVFYFEQIPDNGKGLVQMLMVYMIGRYIRMYQDIRLPKKAGIIFILLWILNGISHEIPIQIGGIYHHLCKDNSITNLIMALILFYAFKELKLFRTWNEGKNGKNGKAGKAVNKAAGYVFAVFALNNTFVTVGMERLLQEGLQSVGGMIGFLELAGIVAAVLLGCLLIGAIRELLFGRLDQKLGIFVENKLTFLH
ncbi:MAG: acyltransferase [Lachnospiraceae bacterium]|nr:acyltransferase [Lachnospiraceae bacterium]